MMAVLVALVLGSQEVRSAPILDQSQTLQDSTLGINSTVQLAQTFTGTVTGGTSENFSLFHGNQCRRRNCFKSDRTDYGKYSGNHRRCS